MGMSQPFLILSSISDAPISLGSSNKIKTTIKTFKRTTWLKLEYKDGGNKKLIYKILII